MTQRVKYLKRRKLLRLKFAEFARVATWEEVVALYPDDTTARAIDSFIDEKGKVLPIFCTSYISENFLIFNSNPMPQM